MLRRSKRCRASHTAADEEAEVKTGFLFQQQILLFLWDKKKQLVAATFMTTLDYGDLYACF